MNALTRPEISQALCSLGLGVGDVVFVHSSLRSMGYVDGGADTVVDAILDVLGPIGTLVVPTFTFSYAPRQDPDPVFDPRRDPSEMGQISEAARLRPGAHRSRHLLHSVAALGSRAEDITAVHGASAWAADGPFWQVHEHNAWILLLGVPYLRATFFHLIEQFLQVPYRQWRTIDARIRESSGAAGPLPTQTFSPKAGFIGNDFNKFGAILEERELTRVGAVGNAVARLFRARHAFQTGVAEYRKDPLLFVRTGGNLTELRDGFLIEELDNEKAVFNPSLIYPKRH
jgi:aminoglycoside 3-N-acetyltransferase